MLALVGLLAVMVAGTVLAGQGDPNGKGGYYERFTSKVAAILGKKPEEVRSAMTQAQKEMEDEAVAQGKVPSERGERIKERIDRTGRPFPGIGRLRHHRGPGLKGEVTKVTDDRLTIQTRQGEKSVLLDAETAYRSSGQQTNRNAVKTGSRVKVRFEITDEGTVVARLVRILPPKDEVDD